MADTGAASGRAFISYVREDAAKAEELQDLVEAAGVLVWRYTVDLLPGDDWRKVIRQAISSDSLVFLACFSSESTSRDKTFQNEELLLAVEQMRLRGPGEPWLIPVRFDDCEIPDLDIGAGMTLASIQAADLFGTERDREADRLVASVQRILSRRADLLAGIPAGSESSVTTYEPLQVRVGQAYSAVPVIVHNGPIEQITDVDILVNSENTYFEMSQSFKASTSSRLRRTAAIRSPSGAILWDLEADGLHAWLRQNQCAGLRLNPGTIAATDAGALKQHGIKRIYHAAITDPWPGTSSYHVNPEAITEAVRNVFATARSERTDPELHLTSICFPLLGSGRGGLDPQASLRKIWQAVTEEARNDQTWTIHFASWKQSEAEMIYQIFSQDSNSHPPEERGS